MEAISAPLGLIRSLYAAQPDGSDHGVKERFSSLLSDPQMAAQVRHNFEMPWGACLPLNAPVPPCRSLC